MAPDLEAGLTTSRAPAAAWLKPEIVFCMVAVLVAALVLVCARAFDPTATFRPTFSVQVASFDGLDGPKPAPTVNPTFNLTLDGVSRRRLVGSSLGLCQEHGTVAVSYAGAVLAWGRVPKFCVPAQARKQVRIVALGADVGLSEELRDRMASERLSWAAELDVDIMLDQQRLLSSRVKLDEPSPKLSPCKVYSGSWRLRTG